MVQAASESFFVCACTTYPQVLSAHSGDSGGGFIFENFCVKNCLQLKAVYRKTGNICYLKQLRSRSKIDRIFPINLLPYSILHFHIPFLIPNDLSEWKECPSDLIWVQDFELGISISIFHDLEIRNFRHFSTQRQFFTQKFSNMSPPPESSLRALSTYGQVVCPQTKKLSLAARRI